MPTWVVISTVVDGNGSWKTTWGTLSSVMITTGVVVAGVASVVLEDGSVATVVVVQASGTVKDARGLVVRFGNRTFTPIVCSPAGTL